jgi:hypothetical protein
MNETSYFHDIPGLGHVWTAPWQELFHVAALVGCGHVSGPLVRCGWPLALMLLYMLDRLSAWPASQGSDRNGKFIFGALGIFALKLKLHRTWCGWRPRFQRHDCR